MVIRVKHSGFLPRQGWQLCRVTGGSFAVKWVAAFVCNRWQLCREIRIKHRVTRAVVPELVHHGRTEFDARDSVPAT